MKENKAKEAKMNAAEKEPEQTKDAPQPKAVGNTVEEMKEPAAKSE